MCGSGPNPLPNSRAGGRGIEGARGEGRRRPRVPGHALSLAESATTGPITDENGPAANGSAAAAQAHWVCAPERPACPEARRLQGGASLCPLRWSRGRRRPPRFRPPSVPIHPRAPRLQHSGAPNTRRGQEAEAPHPTLLFGNKPFCTKGTRTSGPALPRGAAPLLPRLCTRVGGAGSGWDVREPRSPQAWGSQQLGPSPLTHTPHPNPGAAREPSEAPSSQPPGGSRGSGAAHPV